MSEQSSQMSVVQDHQAYLDGTHDFQIDIEHLVKSDLVRTILETVMLATNARFAAVARVTNDRWVACRSVDEVNFGIAEGDEIEIQSTFCQTVRDTGDEVIFNNVATDKVYRDDPIAAKFGIVSYASVPIYRSDGSFFGTLCAIDTEPRDLGGLRAHAMLKMFANLIGRSLSAEERIEAQELELEHERKLGQIQEEFVAILGHDLRNPVAAFASGLRLLGKEPMPDKARSTLNLMRAPLHRMNELIDNLMLHAKSRLGGGINIRSTDDAPLAVAVTEVVDEIRAVAPERQVELDLRFDRPITCDASRIAQAVSNLLSNAMSHGAPGTPIKVVGECSAGQVIISVANQGQEIPAELRENLFRPFQRGRTSEGEGLGLGLHIASTIARAHGGVIAVDSNAAGTVFSVQLPG